MNSFKTVLILLVIYQPIFAQLGGKKVFTFTRLPNSASAMALGYSNISLYNTEINACIKNPSLLNSKMEKELSISHTFLPAKISYLNMYYATPLSNKKWVTQFGIDYVNYGKIDIYNAYLQNEGDTKAYDAMFTAGTAYKLSRVHVGANVKLVQSKIDAFNATAMLFDLGFSLLDTTRHSALTLLFANTGIMLNKFDNEREKLPFNIQLAFSKKLKHLPLRFQIVADNLQQFDIAYYNPNDSEVDLFGELQDKSPNFFDKAFRHFSFGTEISLKKVVFLRAGYNHFRRKEMSLDSRSGLAGFGFGIGIHTKKIRFDYGLGSYHPNVALHQISFSTNISNWKK